MGLGTASLCEARLNTRKAGESSPAVKTSRFRSGTRTEPRLVALGLHVARTECLLKAENYAHGRQHGRRAETRMALLEQAAIWRSRAFELRMQRFEHLRDTAPRTRQSQRRDLRTSSIDRPKAGLETHVPCARGA